MSAIWIIDFGSQYTQLITRKTRELDFHSVILTVEDAKEKLLAGQKPMAIILSGGPQSVFEDTEDYTPFFQLEIPILGICYGMQLMAKYYGGTVEKGTIGEYGKSEVIVEPELSLPFKKFTAWMSHSDHVSVIPGDFKVVIKSDNGLIAGIQHTKLPRLGLQFHPEVHHTEKGAEVLSYFFKEVSKLQENWKTGDMLEECLTEIKKAKDSYVLCAFSGGVDSLVAAAMAHEVLGDKLYCFFVDHGLLRPQDYHHIEELKREMPLNIEVIDAKAIFMEKLQGEGDPEKKRKIIGNTFIDVFENKVHEFENNHNIEFKFLLQGTLYPDVIESVSPHKQGGKSVTIKSHHNVGGLPEKMKLKLIEPLKYLFKDEVRVLGEKIKLKKNWIYRHPFPGPGIGIRVLGMLSEEAILKVQQSDQILFEELQRTGNYNKSWQAFTVLIPQKTVGVKGDYRAYEEIIAVRIVNSIDGMTATWSEMPYNLLDRVSSRITNEVKGVTRVVYDITSKPPGTIEWE